MSRSSPSTSTSRRRTSQAALQVLAYFDERHEAFTTALHAAQAYYAVEGVHELRVEVKRLRALFKLVGHMAPAFASQPNAASLRELFRSAGELREIDIHQSITLEWLPRLDLREYYNELKQRELRRRRSFDEVCVGFSSASLRTSRARLHSALAITTGDRMQVAMAEHVHRLAEAMQNRMDQRDQDTDNLHAVRKVSKTLRYTLDVWHQCFGQAAVVEDAASRLKNAGGHLGEWRDTLLTIESVDAFLKQKSRKQLADPPAYEIFRSELQDRAHRLLEAYYRSRKTLRRTIERVPLHLLGNCARRA